jgi:hypothetical protein
MRVPGQPSLAIQNPLFFAIVAIVLVVASWQLGRRSGLHESAWVGPDQSAPVQIDVPEELCLFPKKPTPFTVHSIEPVHYFYETQYPGSCALNEVLAAWEPLLSSPAPVPHPSRWDILLGDYDYVTNHAGTGIKPTPTWWSELLEPRSLS